MLITIRTTENSNIIRDVYQKAARECNPQTLRTRIYCDHGNRFVSFPVSPADDRCEQSTNPPYAAIVQKQMVRHRTERT